jgi:hypothetical protein
MWSCAVKCWFFQNGYQASTRNFKLLKIQKLKDFNGNGYLQGVWHASPYGDHVGFLWWPPKYKNTPIWGNFGLQVDYVLANWYPSSFFKLGAMLWSFRWYHILLWLPNVVCEPYYFCSVSSYYYYCWVMYCYSIILIILIIIILAHIFVRSISRRCVNQALWNLVGISYAMWSCAVKGWFFQNGCRCHGNGQNAKKLKNTKMIIANYSPNRNWWNLTGTTSTSSGTR